MRHRGRLFCFSPPVMMATFIIEVVLAVYLVVRYKLTAVTRIVAAILVLLATFQLAEWNVCGGMGASAAAWSRVGFVAITLLPPLGLHLVYALAKRPAKATVMLGYTLGIIWVLIFGTSEWAFSGHVCGGNYVMFQLRQGMVYWYGMYYYSGLLLTIGLAYKFAIAAKHKVQRSALLWLIAGYSAFMLPTAITNSVSPDTTRGIPSILCGFAVFLGLILALIVVPRMAEQRPPRS